MAKLLLLTFFVFATAGAQTTHHVNWGIGVPPSQTTITIEKGDTVMWMWTSAHPHTVTNKPGSTEIFDSGTITGIGQTYSHTFTEVGVNPYVCLIHASMQGTITVEETMGTKNTKADLFEFYPNPVTDVVTIHAEKNINSITVFDMQGRKIMETTGGNPTSKIYMSAYPAGTYIFNVTAGEETQTISVVKK
jgi:plastocyanin